MTCNLPGLHHVVLDLDKSLNCRQTKHVYKLLLLLLVACQFGASLLLHRPQGLACKHAAAVLKGRQAA